MKVRKTEEFDALIWKGNNFEEAEEFMGDVRHKFDGDRLGFPVDGGFSWVNPPRKDRYAEQDINVAGNVVIKDKNGQYSIVDSKKFEEEYAEV